VPTPSALVLVAGCALAWSLYDLNRKALVERISPTPLLVLLTAGQAPLLGAWALAEGGGLGPGYLLPATGSIALNLVANVAFVHAFRVAPLSVAVPLLSLTPALATLASIPLLGEVPTARQMAGVAAVVAGAVLVNLPAGGDAGPAPVPAGTMPGSAGLRAALVRHGARHRGAWLMVVVAL
jgi:drug/metabolite transporter (DMT)-like permease